MKEIAQKHQKAEGQVLLRHLIQKGIAIISKSATPERIRQNIDIFYFALDESDVKALDALDKGAEGRIFNFLFFKGYVEFVGCITDFKHMFLTFQDRRPSGVSVLNGFEL